jgi:arsenate reductase
VFTLCDYAESRCPTSWLLAQNHSHWDILDPTKVQGTEEQIIESFRAARDQLDENIKAWLAEQNKS